MGKWIFVILAIVGGVMYRLWLQSGPPKRGKKQLPPGRRGGGSFRSGGGGGSFRVGSGSSTHHHHHHHHDDDASAAVIADRLLRAADRYENAGDHERAERAREAASNLRDDDLDDARRIEDEILRPADDVDIDALPQGNDAGLSDSSDEGGYTDNS